jgi:hypothetical protein
MKTMLRSKVLWLALLLAALGVLSPGCSTTGEQENRSERPWNQPRNWETGLPSSLYDRR